MKYILYKYDSDYERVTIRADDIVIGTLSEIKVDNVVFVIQTATIILNFKNRNR